MSPAVVPGWDTIRFSIVSKGPRFNSAQDPRTTGFPASLSCSLTRIVFKNFGAWSFKSDSGLGQRSVRLQRLESGGPGLSVLVWKAYAVYITVGN